MRDFGPLITTEQLADALGEADLRVFDCTTYLEPAPPGSTDPYLAVPGRASFEKAHIPGADFLDLQGEFSDPNTHLRFMMPDTRHLEQAFGRHGIDPTSNVVLYSIGGPMWATRFWWMLKSLGFDASVLNGGLDKWQAEGRPTENGPPHGYPPAAFKASPQPGYFVDRSTVLGALRDPKHVIVNALGPQFHQGHGPSRYGRPGRIPGSVNVPAATLLDPTTKEIVKLDAAKSKFEAQGISKDKTIVCYCGGGISATVDLFMLSQLGYSNLTLYDASMGEWARDETLPIEVDR
jgi:thiosulfate/3-mercaptopyruvate sulfurtransferase